MDFSKSAATFLSFYVTISTVWVLTLCVCAYTLSRIVYHLYLSPLSKFPGPTLAACSRWLEFYYEIFLDGGYLFKIQKLHEQYGWYFLLRSLL